MLFSAIRKTLFLVLFFAAGAQATEFYEPVQTVRQLGMGGVYVFNQNDGASFTQNPAYSCFTKGLNWSVANLDLALGDGNNSDFIQDLSESRETPNESNISDFMGKSIHVKLGGFSSMTLPCFGTALYYNAVAGFMVRNPAFPSIDTFYLTDTGFAVGGAVKLGENISLGLDVKRIQRKGGPYTFGPESIALLDEEGGFESLLRSVENGGTGYGLDLGVVSRLESVPFNPTASLSWKDVGSTAFVKTTGEDAPGRQKDNLVLGLTFDTSLPLLGIAGGMEYRHITDNDEQIGKKLHVGMEVSVAMFDVRAGLHQGYPTYGVGVDFWFFQLQAALYDVEKGVYPGQTPEKRGQIGLSLDLEFDPNFKLVDSGGKKRRLKQRR